MTSSYTRLDTRYRQGFDAWLLRSRTKPILLIANALDECEEAEVREVVEFLKSLASAAVASGSTLSILLSIHYYLTITMRRMLELVVESQVEHDEDISLYVEKKLKFADLMIRRKLLRKAGSAFMWVVLVTEMLN
ncbi:hypothetical protein ABW20_dc0104851 [Dactylellina cionopaga]|nr:hypothetical protein ABW20_dc0104851 [Dactylellina cionopaga]